MKKCVFFVFICFVFVANTQEVLLYEYLNVNNIRALINPVGNQFNDFDNNNVFQVPADSSTMTIYSSSLWIGGKDANSQLKFAGEQSRGFGKDFFPGPLVANGSNIATITDSVSQSWNRLWRMTREEIDQFVLCFNNPSYPSYEIPNSIIEWPANGDAGLEQASHLAPYFDNNNDGYYNPFDGDHPIIKGDECLFFIFNDMADEHTESQGAPLGIEVQGMAYAFGCTESESFDNTIFINYKIINRRTYILFTTYLGIYTDFDIGFYNDDYIGCNVQKSAFYAYNGDAFDETSNGVYGYGENPPAQAVVILKGAPNDPDGMDNSTSYENVDGDIVLSCNQGDILNGNINGTNYGDGVVDNELYGMTRFAYFNSSGTGANNNTLTPSTATHYYNYMTGHWLDYTDFLYGGTGHYSGGADSETQTKFMFPGSPTSDVCGWGQGGVPQEAWSEETEFNAPGDRKGVGISGPFTFYPSQELEFEIAYVFARSEEGTTEATLNKLFACIDTVRNSYTENITPCGTSFVYNGISKPNLSNIDHTNIYPNPANDILRFDFNRDADYQIQILDINGKIIALKNVSASNCVFDISSFDEGVYFVKISDGVNFETKKLVVVR